MMKAVLFSFVLAVVATFAVGTASAQQSVIWQPTGVGDWYADGNWQGPSGNFVPNYEFDERAFISNGGTAFAAASGPGPADVLLGQAAGASGHLEIRSGGSLSVQTIGSSSLANGGVIVGGAGQGTLTVLPGGSLSTVGPLESGASPANVVIFGGAGLGTASVAAGNTTLRGTTHVYPNATFAGTGSLAFAASSEYQVELTPTSAATLNVTGPATIGGALHLNVTGSPALGATWSLVEAASVSGLFSSVDTSLALPFGRNFVLRTVPIAGNRQRLEASLREVLVLNVNRDTGVVSLTQPGVSSITLDGYAIQSSEGRLVPAAWNSVSDQAALGGGWIEANPSSTKLAELKTAATGAMNAGSSLSLGASYNPLAGAFGAASEDLHLRYTSSDGSVIDGVVKYTGTKVNNLLLQVDPGTGQARLRNTSATTVDIDGYLISSAASALLPTGWNSLDDQNAAGGDWLEIGTASTSKVGELKRAATTTLAPGASFSLGSLFNVSGSKDLMFEYLLSANSTPLTGVVVYEPITSQSADFDSDGDIDGADFLRWQRGFGISSGALPSNGDANGDGAVNAADLVVWKNQFGTTPALAAAGAVPEPTAAALATLLLVLPIGRRARGQ